jgi:secreted PhoX family phosphatase
MGRFNHEAIAVDPKSGIVFQTEDRDDGLIYRYIPKRRGNLEAGGKLQALKVVDHPSTDTRNWSAKPTVRVGEQLPVEWIDMEDILSPKDDMRIRGFNSGAARFARGEGMWYGRGSIFFACTNGGSKKLGQIWRYFPSPDEGTLAEEKSPGRLELFVEPNNSKLVQAADNLTVSPWGDLIVCEDRTGKVIRMVGVTPKGKFYTFAKNHVNTEFAGSCFSPDGSTLFVNIQKKGLTVAITGPWKKSGT